MSMQLQEIQAFRLLRPRHAGPVIFAAPHAGREYPAAFLAQTSLTPEQIRSSEDAFVDRLIAQAPEFGAPALLALVPRAYIDFNRGADELDPAVIEGLRGGVMNARVRSGLGVIARVVSGGRAIYRGKISLAEAQARITQCWEPWHAMLRRLMDEAQTEHGQAILVDMHSMPSDAIDKPHPRPQIILGDRFGTSASAAVTALVEAAFVAEGFIVARNAPFAGAYITQAHGLPLRGRHVVQVEIDRSLYMDEARVRPLPEFEAFAARITRVIGRITSAADPARLAAQ